QEARVLETKDRLADTVLAHCCDAPDSPFTLRVLRFFWTARAARSPEDKPGTSDAASSTVVRICFSIRLHARSTSRASTASRSPRCSFRRRDRAWIMVSQWYRRAWSNSSLRKCSDHGEVHVPTSES